jgi:hypothetical protein
MTYLLFYQRPQMVPCVEGMIEGMYAPEFPLDRSGPFL